MSGWGWDGNGAHVRFASDCPTHNNGQALNTHTHISPNIHTLKACTQRIDLEDGGDEGVELHV